MKYTLTVLFIAMLVSGCSTLQYITDDTELQAIQGQLDAKEDEVKAKLKAKVGKVEDKIDRYRETADYKILERIIEAIREL